MTHNSRERERYFTDGFGRRCLFELSFIQRALDQHTLHYTSTVDTAAAAITNRTHLTSQQLTEQSQNAHSEY